VRAVDEVQEDGAREESGGGERKKREQKQTGGSGGGGEGGRKEGQGAVSDGDGTGNEVTNVVTAREATKIAALSRTREPPGGDPRIANRL